MARQKGMTDVVEVEFDLRRLARDQGNLPIESKPVPGPEDRRLGPDHDRTAIGKDIDQLGGEVGIQGVGRHVEFEPDLANDAEGPAHRR